MVEIALQGVGNFTTNNDYLHLDFDNLMPLNEGPDFCRDRDGYAPLADSNQKLFCREAAISQLLANDFCDTLIKAYCCESW